MSEPPSHVSVPTDETEAAAIFDALTLETLEAILAAGAPASLSGVSVRVRALYLRLLRRCFSKVRMLVPPFDNLAVYVDSADLWRAQMLAILQLVTSMYVTVYEDATSDDGAEIEYETDYNFEGPLQYPRRGLTCASLRLRKTAAIEATWDIGQHTDDASELRPHVHARIRDSNRFKLGIIDFMYRSDLYQKPVILHASDTQYRSFHTNFAYKIVRRDYEATTLYLSYIPAQLISDAFLRDPWVSDFIAFAMIKALQFPARGTAFAPRPWPPLRAAPRDLRAQLQQSGAARKREMLAGFCYDDGCFQ